VAQFGTAFVLQNDARSNLWNWSYQAGFASQIDTGYQTIYALGRNLPTAMINSVSVDGKYLELYEGDINQSSLKGALTYIHSILG
jgi:hypothetical protein